MPEKQSLLLAMRFVLHSIKFFRFLWAHIKAHVAIMHARKCIATQRRTLVLQCVALYMHSTIRALRKQRDNCEDGLLGVRCASILRRGSQQVLDRNCSLPQTCMIELHS
jgi:hypothetical protein